MNLTLKLLIVCSFLLVHSSGHRIQLSDSILDIINTRHVERIMAERRMNSSSRDDKRYTMVQQNELIDNDEDDDDATENSAGNLSSYQTPEVAIDFDFNGRRQSVGGGGGGAGGSSSTVPSFNNESGFQYHPTGSAPNADILADLQAYRGDKLLKSSKNALVVTRKEYLKKDWCKTEPLVQRIREEGCLSRTIINRFCYGQCNSFYIPKSPKRRRHGGGGGGGRNGHGGQGGGHGHHHGGRAREVDLDFEDEDLTGPAFRSCAFCKPKKFTWITVTLRCPSLVPQLRRKRIQRIKQCKCIAEPLN